MIKGDETPPRIVYLLRLPQEVSQLSTQRKSDNAREIAANVTRIAAKIERVDVSPVVITKILCAKLERAPPIAVPVCVNAPKRISRIAVRI